MVPTLIKGQCSKCLILSADKVLVKSINLKTQLLVLSFNTNTLTQKRLAYFTGLSLPGTQMSIPHLALMKLNNVRENQKVLWSLDLCKQDSSCPSTVFSSYYGCDYNSLHHRSPLTSPASDKRKQSSSSSSHQWDENNQMKTINFQALNLNYLGDYSSQGNNAAD